MHAYHQTYTQLFFWLNQTMKSGRNTWKQTITTKIKIICLHSYCTLNTLNHPPSDASAKMQAIRITFLAASFSIHRQKPPSFPFFFVAMRLPGLISWVRGFRNGHHGCNLLGPSNTWDNSPWLSGVLWWKKRVFESTSTIEIRTKSVKIIDSKIAIDSLMGLWKNTSNESLTEGLNAYENPQTHQKHMLIMASKRDIHGK